MIVNQEFSYTGSSNYEFDNITLNENQVALFDVATGIGGIDYMPYDGATVTVKTGLIGTSTDVQDLQPTLNNKIYYLVTNEDYTDKDRDIILSLATQIPVSLVGGRYEGTFVFSNPNNFQNLYLIWDYTDTMDGGVVSYTGGPTTRYIESDFGSDVGRASVQYNVTGAPTRFIIVYNNAVVSDTGYVGLNSLANYNALIAVGVDPDDIKLVSPYDGLVDNGVGSMDFSKFSSSIENGYVYAYSPLASSSWTLTKINPSLTSFYLDPTDGDVSNVCTQVPATQYWHDGINALPDNNNTIYTDSIGSIVYNGNNALHLMSTTSLVVPPSLGGIYIAVNTNGIVTSSGGCDCLEYAVPFIFQDDIYVTENNAVSIAFAATNNPTSWSIGSSCVTFSLTGGTRGSLFQYTDCNGNTVNVTLNIDGNSNVCGQSGSVSLS